MVNKENKIENTKKKLKKFELIDAAHASEASPIGKIAVFGAGLMGQGISQTISQHGITVKLFDRNQRLLENGLKALSDSMDHEIERWRMTAADKRAILARIEQGKSMEEVGECELVIESIVEDMEEKKNLLKELDYYTPRDTVFVSNTSSLSLTELAKATRREDHIYMEGVASVEGIDQAMKLGFNFPVGPLHLADQMGLDEVLKWMEILFRELGDLKYRPCPILRKLVRMGHLGVKTGQGFYKYDNDNHR